LGGREIIESADFLEFLHQGPGMGLRPTLGKSMNLRAGGTIPEAGRGIGIRS